MFKKTKIVITNYVSRSLFAVHHQSVHSSLLMREKDIQVK